MHERMILLGSESQRIPLETVVLQGSRGSLKVFILVLADLRPYKGLKFAGISS